ncbi:MAG: hypothetical protein R3F61_07325 [Myxococcota bacterium]
MASTLDELKAVLRTPGARWTLGILGAVVLVGGATTWWIVNRARSTECEIAKHDPLSMDELVSVKKRFTAYKRNPEAGLTLSGPEISMLLEDRADVPVYVDVKGTHLHAQVAVPASDSQCYPIDFEGQISVDDGVAYVTPDRLVIGRVDLSTLARGVRMELLPENMPTAKSALFLEQTRAASVQGGELQVELQAPAEFTLNR